MKGSLTVTRSSDGVIRIRIRDEASRITFVEIEMSPHDFAMALTGLSECEGDMEVQGLMHVGSRRVYERRSVVCPLSTYGKDELKAWLIENAQEEGWTLDTYLGAQGSISLVEGGTRINYGVFKYVKGEQA